MTESLTPEILRELLLVENRHAIANALEDVHPRDLAEVAAELDDAELWQLLGRLDPPYSATVFSHLPMERQVRLVRSLDPRDAADLLEMMPSDDRVDLVQHLDAELRQNVMSRMEEPERRDVERLAIYEEGTAGAVMTGDVTTLRSNLTVAQAMEHLRAAAERKETIYYNYVVDENDKLIGIVSLRDLVLADPQAKLSDVMNEDVISVNVHDPVGEVERKISEYDLLALPVVDATGRLSGLVTVDDVLDVAEEEATEDFERIAAVAPLREGFGAAGMWLLYRKRIPWLLVLVLINIFSGAGIAMFQDTINRYLALVFFLPLLIDSGGNAGSQSATLMVRALATGEVLLKDWMRLLGREVLIALAMGLTMSLAVSLLGFIRAPEVAVVVALAMVLVVLVGSVIGMLLPFLLTRFNMDPATASAPLITSLADIAGVLIYFGIATLYLGLPA